MTYNVNDIFYTLQGEGYWTGRPAVFCRFSRCNLWTGLEEDRHGAICKFCDTDFTASTDYEHDELIDEIERCWPGDDYKMVVFTGGEPALQVTHDLVWNLQLRGFYVAIETNGTRDVPANLDWVCVSPKTTRLRIRAGHELKLVYPQKRITPNRYERLIFHHYWLSPMDGPDLAANTAAAVEYVLAHPQWRLSLQTHKVIGVP